MGRGAGWRSLSWAAACLIVVLYVGCGCAAVWLERRLGLRFTAEDVLLLTGFGAFALVGALLVAKRPANLIGWVMVAISLVGPVHTGDLYAAFVITTRGGPGAMAVFAAWVNMWYWYVTLALALVYLPLLFPDGRPPSRRWLPVAALAGFGVVVMVCVGAISETLIGTDVPYRIANPIGVEGVPVVEEMPVFGTAAFGVLGVGAFGAFASVVVRFRRSTSVERQQLKWFLYACAFLPATIFLEYVPEIVDTVVFGAVIIALPTSVGFAVLKHRLYDIDAIINRTLVYGTLTGALVLVYLGGVVGLQYLVRALTGEGSQLAVVASTLVVAALVGPLRRRIQTTIDRRFYRAKYDARRTLEAFSAKLRDETSLDSLSESLTTVVEDTLRPSHSSLWLRTGDNPDHPRPPLDDYSRQSSTRSSRNPS